MKATTLMLTQLVSLLILTASANGLFENAKNTFAFILSFTIFALSSIYIGNHQNELLKELENEYGA